MLYTGIHNIILLLVGCVSSWQICTDRLQRQLNDTTTSGLGGSVVRCLGRSVTSEPQPVEHVPEYIQLVQLTRRPSPMGRPLQLRPPARRRGREAFQRPTDPVANAKYEIFLSIFTILLCPRWSPGENRLLGFGRTYRCSCFRQNSFSQCWTVASSIRNGLKRTR